MHRDLNYDEAVRMSWGLAQENGHVMMVQNTAWEGYEEISPWIMQDYKGDEAIGARGAPDQEGAMASMAYGARIMKELGLVPADVTIAMVGTAQEEDCDGLCRQYDEALQTRANTHSIFRSLPSAPPGSASSPVASAEEGSRASSTILARLGIPSANSTGRARIDKTEAHPTSLSIVALRRKQAFRPFSGAPCKDTRLYLSRPSFDADSNGIWPPDATQFRGERQGNPWGLRLEDETFIYEDELQRAVPERCALATTKATLRNGLMTAPCYPLWRRRSFVDLSLKIQIWFPFLFKNNRITGIGVVHENNYYTRSCSQPGSGGCRCCFGH